MPTWTHNELNKIGNAEELEIMPRRSNGTLRKPTTIWVVRVDDDLYVRSWRGRTSGWYCGTQMSHEGRIRAGDIEKDVDFADADPNLNDQIDTAYRSKYGRYTQYVTPMVASEARSTTLKLIPL